MNSQTSINFYAPSGDEYANPDDDWLRAYFLHPSPDFWNSGAGQGALYCERQGAKTQIVITYDHHNGFYLEFTDQNEVTFIPPARAPLPSHEEVVIYVGGDRARYPARHFLNPSDTWKVISHFVGTGTIHNLSRWTRLRDLSWNYWTQEK